MQKENVVLDHMDWAFESTLNQFWKFKNLFF